MGKVAAIGRDGRLMVNAQHAGYVPSDADESYTEWTGASGSTAPNGWDPMGTNRTYTIDSSSGSGAEPALRMGSGAAGNAGMKLDASTVSGRRYRAKFSYKCEDSGTVLKYMFANGDTIIELPNSTSWVHGFEVYWTGSGATNDFILGVTTANKDGWFDNVEITALSSNYISEGAVVTDDLALYLDAADYASYPGHRSLATAWVDYNSQQANYDVVGDDGVILLGTYTSWMGRFNATTTATGNHTVMFDYWSDNDNTAWSIDNDGIQNNDYNTTLDADKKKKTFSKTVNLTSTGASYMYMRNHSTGSKVYVANYRFFKNGTTWYDLSGNGYNATVGSSVEFQTDKGVSLKCLNSETNTNQKIESNSFSSVTWKNFTFELWFTDNGSQGGDPSAFGFDNGGVSSYGARYNGTVQTWIDGTLDFTGTAADTGTTMCHLAITGDGQTFKFYINGSLTDTETADVTNAGAVMTRYHLNSDSRTSSNNGWNGNYAICRMYNRTLSIAQINQNFNAERNRFGV